jgi:purine-binding chemotaxis protein CheW
MSDFSERVRHLQQEIARQEALPEEQEQEALPVLTFSLTNERYALPLNQVREVSRPGSITPLPGLPSTIVGATGLRGEVLAVLDLMQLLGLGEYTPTPECQMVVVRHEDAMAAFLIDRVEDIDSIPQAALRPPPEDTQQHTAMFLQGVAGEGEATIRLLDLASLLETLYHGA